MQQRFEIGELVHCETDDGTWVGEVIATQKHSLTVKWFGDGRNHDIPYEQAVPFGEFLDAQKRSRKLKFVYAEFFGGPPMDRMPQKRLDELRRVLREHGVQFNESCTRANETFPMSMNRAHLTRRERDNEVSPSVLSDEVAEWLPKWLVSDPLPPSSRDPLGLQADAGRLADQLLPGLTVFIYRVGYFFFLAWALQELNKHTALTAGERREAINRLERALVMCETLHHGPGGISECYHQGQRAKRRLLAQATTTASIPDRILKNQNNTGCYNLYRTAMLSCGVWEEDAEAGAAGQLPFQLTERGMRFASAFARRDGSGELLRWALNVTGRRDVQVLQTWGESLCFCTFQDVRSEKKWFLDGFLFAQDDRLDVVRDADIRLHTVRTLASAGLLSTPSQTPAISLVNSETAGADVTELEDAPDWGENVTFLLHFYRHRGDKDTEPFVSAAIYELLGLALNAIFAGLLDSVREHGRMSLNTWMVSLAKQSHGAQLWNTFVRKALSGVKTSEEQLVKTLFRGERIVEHGLMLALKVLAREENRKILQQQLANTAIWPLLDTVLLSDTDKPVGDALLQLARQLVEHHHHVSLRKGKERWLDIDGSDVLNVDAPGEPMILGFHSYRFPQLMSLARDLQLTEDDLGDAQC